MGLPSTVLLVAGAAFLSHAVYSSYEHALLFSPSISSGNKHPLPLDIVLELLVSITVLCAGIVLAAPKLKPISWRVWAREKETEEKNVNIRRRKEEDAGLGAQVGNPFAGLEDGSRRGFLDVRGARKAFAEWVREGGGGGRS
ncbi:hypothetical protein K402DRAFT_23510 [Aulographum hederae CBS 113979]|uniref:Magnesium transporter n=1 Tax=Aulographum hederae CBS 113979 TaxID=1176131 RepID=A0A6G1H5T7_9PEZI|nr:hypothetical protein K402DRAFT_23510 [Aulographum hederae CBS 113979]